ncbi:hypothetical protein [Corallococcus exiguus]|uniref:Uncharacterized protein n=1 Tax=Corallococcus exiguus TaxID=83462 RepID=A0A7X5BRV1_9BACT|nr:hypothetical protein [Corallococcus exiguus]NBC41445.1 hypothetical protein [Corallococcus exiguus]TNV67149.1 hypothetical protein FH620_02705 [Corallococcus exiguus]
MYATVADLRAEGVTAAMAGDTRLAVLLEEAMRTIDKVTGWHFEPRSATLHLDGRGTPSLWLPVPPIRLYRLALYGEDVSFSREHLVVVGAPVGPGFDGPRLTFRHGRVFPRGEGNITVGARWGYTEADGTPEGRTPLAIRRACMLLVLRSLSPLADEDSLEERTRWRVVEERTREQSYRLDSIRPAVRPLTGEPEVDTFLAPYVKPSLPGAV